MRRVWHGVWGAGLAAWLLAGCQGSGNEEGAQQVAGGPGSAKPLPVDVMELKPGPVRDAGEYLGTLISRRSITLYPQVAGYIQRITARPGQRVKAGQVLLEVDPRRERAGVRSAQAQRKSAEAQRRFAQSTRPSSCSAARTARWCG
jgi:multidrug efflux pump subunit AcrA (membrane-fusion protein)